MPLLSEPAEVERLVEAIAAAPAVGFDCEFLSQDRLVPQLCLLQLAYQDGQAQRTAVVDCLAVDVGDLVAALCRHLCPVAHAPRQDLQLLAARFGAAMPQVFDLQIAAAFVGLGDQLGYGRLVAAVLDVELAKGLQWTDWSRRPLSDAHLAYATADVEYLLPLYRELMLRLGARAPWARAESQRLAEVARQAAEVREEDAWEDVAGGGALPPRSTAVMMELAAWRLATARLLDRPLGHVLSDKALVELARRPPRDSEALRRRTGSQVVRERCDEVVAALQRAEQREPNAERERRALPSRPRRGPLSPRAEAWAAGLLLIVELIATREHIAPRLLATRADVEALARAYDIAGAPGIVGHPAMNGWRRHVVGELCEGWLRGELAIVADERGSDGGEGTASVRLVSRGG